MCLSELSFLQHNYKSSAWIFTKFCRTLPQSNTLDGIALLAHSAQLILYSIETVQPFERLDRKQTLTFMNYEDRHHFQDPCHDTLPCAITAQLLFVSCVSFSTVDVICTLKKFCKVCTQLFIRVLVCVVLCLFKEF